MFAKPVVVIDFETTGLSPRQGARVTEVAALRIVGSRIIERYTSLINCGVRVPYEITALTGITQRMVDSAPKASIVIPALHRFVAGSFVVAHNSSFDSSFLYEEYRRVDLQERHQFICSLRLARRLYPTLPDHKLTTVARHIGATYRGAAHRAEADAEVTCNVLLAIAAEAARASGKRPLDPDLLCQLQHVPIKKTADFFEKWRTSV